MPYGDEKSYSFFKMKYQTDKSAFPFKEEEKKKEIKIKEGINPFDRKTYARGLKNLFAKTGIVINPSTKVKNPKE